MYTFIRKIFMYIFRPFTNKIETLNPIPIGDIINIIGCITNISSFIVLIKNIINENISISTYIAIGLLVLVSIYLMYKNYILDTQKNNLIFLAQRSHIYTIYMILLREYFKKYHDNERMNTDFLKTNNFTISQASFTFEINKKYPYSDFSDVYFKHKFLIESDSDTNIFQLWLFGENNSIPQNGCIKLDNNTHFITLSKLKSCNIESSNNDSIYISNFNLGDFHNIEKKEVYFSYKRAHLYHWKHSNVFIIYPKSYAKKFLFAKFKVIFNNTNYNKQIHIKLLEYSYPNCKQYIFPNPTIKKINNKIIYFFDNVKINIQSIYSIIIE